MKSSRLIYHISCLIYLSYLQNCINYSRLCIIMISTCHLAAGRLPVNTRLLRGRLLLRRGLPGVVLPHLRCRDVHGDVSRVTCHVSRVCGSAVRSRLSRCSPATAAIITPTHLPPRRGQGHSPPGVDIV